MANKTINDLHNDAPATVDDLIGSTKLEVQKEDGTSMGVDLATMREADGRAVTNVYTAHRTLTVDDVNAIAAMDSESDLELRFPDNDAQPIPVGSVGLWSHDGDGGLIFVATGDAVLRVPEGCTAESLGQWNQGWWRKSNTNEFRIFPNGLVAGASLVGVPHHLTITTQPGDAESEAPLDPQPVVEVRDIYNEVCPDATGDMEVEILSGTGVLLGTTTVACVAGEAVFTDLNIEEEDDFTLGFTYEDLDQVESEEFTIGAPAAPGVVIEDAFAGTNGTAITSHTVAPTNVPTSSWEHLTGGAVNDSVAAVTIEGNRVRFAQDAAAANTIAIETGLSDCEIEFDAVTVSAISGQHLTACFRAVDVDNRLVAGYVAGGAFYILKTVAGVDTYLYGPTGTPPATTASVKVVLNGTTIELWVDGVLITSVTDATNLTATKHGLRIYTAALGAVECDNFKVTG